MFVIRRATGDESEAFAAVHQSARLKAMPWLPQVHSVTQVQSYFVRVLESQECWVAEVEGKVAGLSALNGDWLDHLYVAPDFQGIGIGSSLLAIAKNLSPMGLQLWTFQENHYARTFYGKHGFVEMEVTDGARNEELTPDVRLIWPSNTGVNPIFGK